MMRDFLVESVQHRLNFNPVEVTIIIEIEACVDFPDQVTNGQVIKLIVLIYAYQFANALDSFLHLELRHQFSHLMVVGTVGFLSSRPDIVHNQSFLKSGSL